jgi:pSer/pThr/pTyr-binding forkhead associated (FHA) protein
MEPGVSEVRIPLPRAGNGDRVTVEQGKDSPLQLSLVVMTAGKDDGRTIPITANPFRIGRDPKCHLRPASPIVSKQHCALLIQGNRVLVQDFKSTNGTFVNGLKVEGEKELHDSERIEVGPLVFGVRINPVTPSADHPSPIATPEQAAQVNNDTAIGTVLPPGPQEAEPANAAGSSMECTVAECAAPESPKHKLDKPAPAPESDTSAAAKNILDAYLKRRKK